MMRRRNFKGKKRTFKNKRFARSRGNLARRGKFAGNSHILKLRNIGFPDVYYTKLKWTINAAGTGDNVNPGIYYAHYINTLFKADNTTPMAIPFFGDCAGIWSKYRVYGVKVKVHFNVQNATNKSYTIIFSPQNTTTGLSVNTLFNGMTSTIGEAFASNPWTVTKFVNASQTSNSVIEKYIDLRRFVGPKMYMVDDLFTAGTGGGGVARANPTNLIFGMFGIWQEDGTALSNTAQINITIQYTFYCQFFERVYNNS